VAPDMDKFTEFWSGIWEDEAKTKDAEWIERIKKKMLAKVKDIENFEVSKNMIRETVCRRKNRTAPAVDGIQNYW
jgi:hypothetical protein